MVRRNGKATHAAFIRFKKKKHKYSHIDHDGVTHAIVFGTWAIK